jgi:regulator of replication initiation timing
MCQFGVYIMSDTEILDAPADDESFTPPEVETELAEISLEDVISRLEQQDSRLQGVDNMQHTVSSQLGRIQNLQSAVDKLSNNDATESLRLQVQQLTDNFDVISEALTDLIPEEAQMAMRNKQLENRLNAIEQNANAQPIEEDQQTPDAQTAAQLALWQEASDEAQRIVREMGYDPSVDVPKQVYQDGVRAANGSPMKAIQYVENWAKDNLSEDNAASRLAETKRAAGRGAPPRAGSTPAVDDLVNRVANSPGGLKDLSADDRARVMDHLGPALRQLRR